MSVRTVSAEPDATSAADHLPALDGVRGIAIALVLLMHLTPGREAITGIGGRIAGLARYGWLGVDLFFVLSGLLITRILLATRDREGYFRTFYARRVLRIFPAYYALLILVLAVAPHLLTVSPDVRGVLQRQAWLWTYTTNLTRLEFDAGWVAMNHCWSLAVEEQFYVVWPAVAYVLGRRRLSTCCVALIVTAPVIRMTLLLLGHWNAVYFLTPARIDALAMGAWLACNFEQLPRVTTRILAVGLIAGAATLVIAASGNLALEGVAVRSMTAMFARTASFSLAGLAFASVLGLVVAGRFSPLRRVLESAPLRSLGKYSYGIYLVHYALLPLFHWLIPLERLAHATGPAFATCVFFFSGVSITFVVAGLSWLLIERPFLELKKSVRTGAIRGSGRVSG